MPTIDLASQYAYLAKFNNYDLYYKITPPTTSAAV